jgi:alpha-tubulin suppressor-like RCC1 family protein
MLSHGRCFGKRTVRAHLYLAGFFLISLLGCHEEISAPEPPELSSSQAAATTTLSFRQISAFEGHTCGVTTSDQAYCWGYNLHGQGGNGTRVHPQLRPVAVAGGHRFRQVSTGVFHTCGVTVSNQALCWGENHSGQRGDGTTTARAVPTPVVGGIDFREVVTGTSHTCGLALNGAVYCWGDNGSGQLGDGTTGGERHTPGLIARTLRFRHLSAGSVHTCGVATNDRIFCWGFNGLGAVGDGTRTTYRPEPTRVAGPFFFSQVAAGRSHTCGITSDRRTYCWGDNSYGALGHGTEGDARFAPVVVVGDFNFTALDGGSWHTCAITGAARLKCWGGNQSGQLGNGTTNDRSTPGASARNLLFRQVAGGAAYTCGVTLDNQGYCWGSNSDHHRNHEGSRLVGPLLPSLGLSVHST